MAKCVLPGRRKKVPKILVNRQRDPAEQKEPQALWNWGSQGLLTIKTSGNSANTIGHRSIINECIINVAWGKRDLGE